MSLALLRGTGHHPHVRPLFPVSFDSGTNAQVFFLDAINSLKKEHGVAASVFFLDYRLAPEYKYPSQLIETLAGYHYLVNSLGISESKIVLGGDSAGANLASAFLLHLARPNPAIKVPESLGQTPKRPAVGQFTDTCFAQGHTAC